MTNYKIRYRYHFSTTQTDPFLRVRFLFLRGGDERDISPVGHATHAATRRDFSIHCRDGFDGLRVTNIEVARVERGLLFVFVEFFGGFLAGIAQKREVSVHVEHYLAVAGGEDGHQLHDVGSIQTRWVAFASRVCFSRGKFA